MIRVRASVRGPLLAPVRPVVHSEFAAANDTAATSTTDRASGYVRRAFGGYERGWRRRPTQYGSRVIVADAAYNVEIHAAVHETGRRAGTRAGGVTSIRNWILLRGITPKRGNSDGAVLGFAIAISRKHAREGWPNLGSFKGGYYPGQPPRPLERALAAEAAPTRTQYQNAAARVARRLGN